MKVYVKTPARLHLGLIDLRGDLGRAFGGIGLAINKPNVILEAKQSSGLTVVGEDASRARIFAETFLNAYRIEAGAIISIKHTIPEHVGLGSGTQLSLAVAVALAKLFNVKTSIRELASMMGRGRISGIGTAIFEFGGFVIDGGVRAEEELAPSQPKDVPPVIVHQRFPEDWAFVVAVPCVKRGFTDEEEQAIFRQLPPMSAEDVGRICRLIMMKLIPSLVEHDIRGFGEALTQIQATVGDHFAKVQGGKYSTEDAMKGTELMLKLGAYGVGQSSWGPTFYGLFSNERDAEKAAPEIQAFLNAHAGGEVFVVKARNKGAYVKTTKG